MTFRHCSEEDVDAVRAFIKRCPPLTLHTPFTYWVTLRYWGSLCLVAEQGHQIVGYVSAIGAADEPDLIYVWQIGVSPDQRRAGLANQLLKELFQRAGARHYERVQVSVGLENPGSYQLFDRFAREVGSQLQLVVKGEEPTYEFSLSSGGGGIRTRE